MFCLIGGPGGLVVLIDGLAFRFRQGAGQRDGEFS